MKIVLSQAEIEAYVREKLRAASGEEVEITSVALVDEKGKGLDFIQAVAEIGLKKKAAS